jgi:hypothetical protein
MKFFIVQLHDLWWFGVDGNSSRYIICSCKYHDLNPQHSTSFFNILSIIIAILVRIFIYDRDCCSNSKNIHIKEHTVNYFAVILLYFSLPSTGKFGLDFILRCTIFLRDVGIFMRRYAMFQQLIILYIISGSITTNVLN